MSTHSREGVRFTERMSGFVSLHETQDCELGYTLGESESSFLEFVLTISLPTIDRLAAGEGVTGELAGTVLAPRLSPQPLMVSGGSFELFCIDPQRVETRSMRYHMRLEAVDGRAFTLEGTKTLHGSPSASAWRDTTRLPVKLRAAEEAEGPILGCGILRLTASDFLKQLSTMSATNVTSKRAGLATTFKFCRAFARQLRNTYGGIFADGTATDRRHPAPAQRALRTPAPEYFSVVAADGTKLLLERYKGGKKGPVLITHGMAMNNLPFTLTTVDTNLVEFLCARDYDVWLLSWRTSTSLPAARQPFTLDQAAQHDYPAAIDKVLAATGADAVAVVAHCMGSMTTLMALLDGSIAGKVSSVLCLQVGLHVELPALTRLRLLAQLPLLSERLGAVFGVHSLDSCATVDDPVLYRALDLLLKAYPVSGEERCHSLSCKRCAFIYGELLHHDNLNAATHELAGEMIGHMSLFALRHLAVIAKRGHSVSFDGQDAYLANLSRLTIPVGFLYSERNGAFGRESTHRTYELLVKQNGPELHTWKELPGYGHLDALIGKNAAVDVFPHIAEHLERAAQNPGRRTPVPTPPAAAAAPGPLQAPAGKDERSARKVLREDDVREYADGELIFAQGDDSRQMYIISEGAVDLTQTSASVESVVATLGRGEFFGEMALLESQPRSATARARGKSRLVVLTPGNFLLKIRRDPTFACEMLQLLSGRLRHNNDRLQRALTDRATETVLAGILRDSEFQRQQKART